METNTNIVTLHNLLDYNAGRFTSAEAELKRCLPEWIKEASSIQLKVVIQEYLGLAVEHIRRIERFIEDENLNFISSSDPVMLALISDIGDGLACCADAAVKDACILAGIQLINHYKISKYGTATAYANNLSLSRAGMLFHGLEMDEKQIDGRLSQLAGLEVNNSAATPLAIPA